MIRYRNEMISRTTLPVNVSIFLNYLSNYFEISQYILFLFHIVSFDTVQVNIMQQVCVRINFELMTNKSNVIYVPIAGDGIFVNSDLRNEIMHYE